MMDWTPIILGVLAIISAVITGFLIPWLKARTSNEQQQEVQTILRMLMGAAEVYFTSEQGKEKKEWVISKLEEYGIDGKEVGNMIEGMYRQMLSENVIGS